MEEHIGEKEACDGLEAKVKWKRITGIVQAGISILKKS